MSQFDDIVGINGSSDNEEHYESSDDEQSRTSKFNVKRISNDHDVSDEAENNESDENKGKKDANNRSDEENPSAMGKSKLRLSEKENRRRLKKIKKSGVVYLSTIPPYMKPVKLKQILERFGEVGRLYLSPEDPKSYAQRVRSGGNRKKKFVEGWVEFTNKKHAKVAAEALNGNPLGGKKGSFYHDDILNIKYLPGFKWHDLTEQIALEAQERQEKLKAEIAQATRENRVFIDNVEKKVRIEKMKRKNEEDGVSDEANRFKRQFDQKPVQHKKPKMSEDSKKLQNVMSKVF